MNIIQIAFGGKLNEDKKRSVSFLFEHGVSLTDHDFFQQLSLHAFLARFMSWRNRNSLLQKEYFLKDFCIYIYIWMSATRNICEIIPKHLEQTEHLQERNSSRSSSSYTEEEKLFMEKMHLYEMSLDHCQALILTSFSPNTENPDDFYLLPIYLNSVIVLD